MIKRLWCFIRGHDWDGHPEECYPSPKCRRCGEWHPRREIELEMRMRYPQYHNPDGTIKKLDP